MNTKEILVSSPELAELFGVTDRYIRMLAKDEIVKKSGTRGKYLLAESIKGFIAFLRESSSVDVDLKEVKLKKETEKIAKDIELKAIKISELKNELHSANIVRKVMTTMLTNLKGKLLAVPNKIAPLVVGCDNLGDIQDIVLSSIEDVLLELSDYTPELFKNKNIIIENEEVEDEKSKGKGGIRKSKPKKNN
ncbi:MerR family transcriptional regulator [Fusobacterium polymorphum]|uniref:MerR family transcriptional regulator n=1 Tax=Fusobacterium nucleatum subsp. polymorphum TaxID=76857 RepID=A0A2B7YL65_FUSNP|nr:MerR family transcriptional regulator [Fusobacterium polymorphum]PGH21763.1 MerR family transcriptional regulator [Fusobacterium polymorphum]